MVKILSQSHKAAIEQAIIQAEQQMGAELVVAIAPASDLYQSHFMLYGLSLGSIIAAALWFTHTLTNFPYLMAVQFAGMAIFCFTPFIRSCCMKLIPARIRTRRSAHRAYEEYLNITRHVASDVPVVLLYISLAERYAHILTSRTVKERIADAEWNAVIAGLTASIRKEGLARASIDAIGHAAALLTPHFPYTGRKNHLADTVIEFSE